MLGQENPYEAPKVQTEAKRHALYGAFRDNRGLLKINLVLLGLLVLAEGFNVWLEARNLAYVDGSLDIQSADYEGFETLYGLFSTGYSILVVATAVLFFVWLNRSCKNAWMIDREGRDMSITPGWAVGWYFIPFAFWWKPVQSMREIVNASFGRRALAFVVPMWWGASVIETLAGVVYGQLEYDTVEQMRNVFEFEVGFGIVSVVQILFEVWLMVRLTRQQMRLQADFSEY